MSTAVDMEVTGESFRQVSPERGSEDTGRRRWMRKGTKKGRDCVGTYNGIRRDLCAKIFSTSRYSTIFKETLTKLH